MSEILSAYSDINYVNLNVHFEHLDSNYNLKCECAVELLLLLYC